jgi:hypothetical protein
MPQNLIFLIRRLSLIKSNFVFCSLTADDLYKTNLRQTMSSRSEYNACCDVLFVCSFSKLKFLFCFSCQSFLCLDC